eukprot:2288640-Rhodomonas_salina.1
MQRGAAPAIPLVDLRPFPQQEGAQISLAGHGGEMQRGVACARARGHVEAEPHALAREPRVAHARSEMQARVAVRVRRSQAAVPLHQQLGRVPVPGGQRSHDGGVAVGVGRIDVRAPPLQQHLHHVCVPFLGGQQQRRVPQHGGLRVHGVQTERKQQQHDVTVPGSGGSVEWSGPVLGAGVWLCSPGEQQPGAADDSASASTEQRRFALLVALVHPLRIQFKKVLDGHCIAPERG